jgi:hypothetical protein
VNFIAIYRLFYNFTTHGSTKHVWDVFSELCSSLLSQSSMSFADICLLLLLLVFLVFLTFLAVSLICVVPLCMVSKEIQNQTNKSPSNKGLSRRRQ